MFFPVKRCRTTAVLLLLFGVSGGCSRAAYVFKPHARAYHGATPEVAVAPADAKVPAPKTGVGDSVVNINAKTATPSSVRAEVTSAVAHPKSNSAKQVSVAILPAVKRIAPSKMLVGIMMKTVLKHNVAASGQSQLKLRRTLLTVGGVLMAIGVLFFLAALTSYGFEPGLTLLGVALWTFIPGLILLIVGLFQDK